MSATTPQGEYGPEDPDKELVAAVLEGDAVAYRGLVERYQGRVYAVIYGMVRNREDARDLTQDTFVKAYKNLDRFRLESSFYTWVYRIGMNVAIDHLRRMKHRTHKEFDEQIASKDSNGILNIGHFRDRPDDNLHRKELRHKILEALEDLPPEQKQIILLREIEGMSYRQISEVMEIPEGTVMSRLFYARKKLQAALSESHSP